MPVAKILVDTSFIIALVNERDQYHERAIKSADQYDGQSLLVTDGVLLEVANALARGYKAEAIQVIEDLLSAEDVEIVHMTIDLFNRAFDLYKTHQDKTWGLVDCVSFMVMRDRGIRTALTFDRHFVQAGFQVLPSDE
ncbi:type II toxin-antitoxin system VapC family toxin [Nostoc sp. WHI]|uniref:type II toxin-antitoxin system VapC family toxin n=1 Tax=Nostoc sp. WHI TaxID=2650611 RepID=UPI0018C525B4|nr:PIN domain-containing protein [Nostoc sp. WHI]MBG1265233.1 type II toxin-antitoxin system VapC family toxin [Nostoc sp. WHI]